jgi:hypothetical protein
MEASLAHPSPKVVKSLGRTDQKVADHVTTNTKGESVMAVEVHLTGKSMEQRIADRLKNSGDTAHADVSVVHGTGPTRTHTNIHYSRAQKYGEGVQGEDINGKRRGVV